MNSANTVQTPKIHFSQKLKEQKKLPKFFLKILVFKSFDEKFLEAATTIRPFVSEIWSFECKRILFHSITDIDATPDRTANQGAVPKSAENLLQVSVIRFKSGDCDVYDEERSGKPKKFEDEKLETQLDDNLAQTLRELSQQLESMNQLYRDVCMPLGRYQK
ncbi:hypothetical protein PV326_005592 [Microctonus aethiopoides]|nr:hypothetical protein PV326_005592 [Microctonus aethiopoides]